MAEVLGAARAEPADSGFRSQIAVTLDTASGRIFVKGMRQDQEERRLTATVVSRSTG